MQQATAAPREARTHKQRRRRRKTPLEATREAVHVANGAAPTDAATGEPVPAPPVLLTPDLLHNRERVYVLAFVQRFRGNLLSMMAREGVTLDHWPYTDVFDMLNAARRRGRLSDGNRSLVVVELLTAFVEGSLLLRLKYPRYRTAVVDDAEDEPEDDWVPQTESEAAAVGLSVKRPRRGQRRPEPELPGCQGDGGTCKGLRRYGARFCPTCERAEIQRMRDQ